MVLPAYRRTRQLIDECGLGGRLVAMQDVFRTAIRRDGHWHHVNFRWPEVELVRYRGISRREKASLARVLPSQLRATASLRFFDMASAGAVDSRLLEEVIGPGANRYFASAVAEVLCGYVPEEISLAFGVLGARYPIRRAWFLEGGLGSLTGELGRRHAARCGVAVERVRVEGGGVVAETSDAGTLRGRAAILATRASEALELWADAPGQTRQFLGSQRYSQGFGVFLRTSAPVRRADPRGRELFMEIVPDGEGTDALLSMVYLNEMVADGGLVGLGASPHGAASIPDDAELAAKLESEFAALHPDLGPSVTARRLMRWPVFVPAYPVGRARELAAFRAGLAPGPVQLAGDYLYGPMMEAAVRAGQDAAARVSVHVGRPASS